MISGVTNLRVLSYVGLLMFAAIVVRIALIDLFGGPSPFHGHGWCYLWEPRLVASHAISDAVIGLSYVSISTTLVVMVRRARASLPYSWMFLAFGTFIVACGITHLVEVVTLWEPYFWLSADIKIITATASVLVAFLLPPLVPKVLTMIADSQKSRSELERMVHERTKQLEEALARERDAREAAEQSLQRQEEFLRMVSHELRTPLNAISGWTHMLLSLGNPEYDHGLQVIARNTAAQTRVVDDLLVVASLDLKKLKVEFAPVYMDTIMDGALDMVQFAMVNKRQTLLKTVGSHELLCVQGDATRLQQVLVNVLQNAVKYTPDEGQIAVIVTGDERRVRVRITDTGIGIPKGFVPRAFDRFAQADTSTKRTYGGLGIGLTIAKRIVELHGGSIFIRSAGLQKGTTVIVELPYCNPLTSTTSTGQTNA